MILEKKNWQQPLMAFQRIKLWLSERVHNTEQSYVRLRDCFTLVIIFIFCLSALEVTSFLTSSVVGFLKLLLISHFLSQFLYSKWMSSDKFLNFTSSFDMIQSRSFLLISDWIFLLNINFYFPKSFTKLSFFPKSFARSCVVFLLNT